MTTDEIRAALMESTSALQDAQRSAALYEQLKVAKGEATRLQRVCADLTANLSNAMAADDREARETRRTKFRNLAIATAFAGQETGVLRAKFTVSWDGPRYSTATGQTETARFNVDGFLPLPPDVFSWLMEFNADKLPPLILDLAPGDAPAAMDRYLAAMRRGWLEG